MLFSRKREFCKSAKQLQRTVKWVIQVDPSQTILNCLQKCFVYQAQVDSANSRKYYSGTSEDEFKTRYNNLNMSFRNKGHEKKIELSKYVWEMKDKGEDFTIKWSVAAKHSPYICGSKLNAVTFA